MSSACALLVGQRVQDKNNFRGTVRYVGPVVISKKSDAVYVGVEWDDATRGKYDGSVVGEDGATVRYFDCAPGKGSFVKPTALQVGMTFLTALADRYMDREERGGGALTTTTGEVEVEFVGTDKIWGKQLTEKLLRVALVECQVSTVDTEEGAIAKVCPNVIELDLRNNLFSSINEFVPLGRELKDLEIMNVGRNTLLTPSPEIASAFSESFMQLKVLVLSHTSLSWGTIVSLTSPLPVLDELHVCGNGIKSLVEGDSKDEPKDGEVLSGFKSLTILNLSENEISKWSEVMLLRAIPNLKRLMLNDNPLTSIEPLGELDLTVSGLRPLDGGDGGSGGGGGGGGSGESKAADATIEVGFLDEGGKEEEVVVRTSSVEAPFAGLHTLLVSNCALENWASIDALNSFPSLSGVSVKRNPVLSGLGPSQARQNVIARVGALRTLNNSEVRERERSDAEKGYLRRAINEFAKDGVSVEAVIKALAESGDADIKAAFEKAHPRYMPLFKFHGSMAVAGGKTASGGTAYVAVTMRSMAAESCTHDPINKRLPASTPISTIKILASKTFGIEAAMVHLAYRLSSDDVPAPMDDDMKPLYHFVASDKVEILVDEIDALAAERAAEEDAERKRMQMLEQAATADAIRKYEAAGMAAGRAGAAAAGK